MKYSDSLVGPHRLPDEKLAVNWVSKKQKTKKGAEVVFDPAAHREFITGFRKRKQQRRKDAMEQIKQRERQQRLEDRAERRQKLKEDLGLGEHWGDSDAEKSDEEEAAAGPAGAEPQKHTMVFKDQAITTTVNVQPITMDSDEPGPSDQEDSEGGDAAGQDDGNEEAGPAFQPKRNVPGQQSKPAARQGKPGAGRKEGGGKASGALKAKGKSMKKSGGSSKHKKQGGGARKGKGDKGKAGKGKGKGRR